MDYRLIYGGDVTLEELYILNGLGYEFPIEDGEIKHVLHG